MTARAASEPRETEDVAKGVARMIRAVGKRVADQDVDGLVHLVTLGEEVERQLQQAVTHLHDQCGYIWTEIGNRLGVSKQAAHARFGTRPGSQPALHLVADPPSRTP